MDQTHKLSELIALFIDQVQLLVPYHLKEIPYMYPYMVEHIIIGKAIKMVRCVCCICSGSMYYACGIKGK